MHAELARQTGQESQAGRERQAVQVGRAGRHCRTCSPIRTCGARQIFLEGLTGQAGYASQAYREGQKAGRKGSH